jgi:hypothetical protein
MNPFDPNPAPWRAYSDPDASEWVIEDGNGNEILFASTKQVATETINMVVRAVNRYKDGEKA